MSGAKFLIFFINFTVALFELSAIKCAKFSLPTLFCYFFMPCYAMILAHFLRYTCSYIPLYVYFIFLFHYCIISSLLFFLFSKFCFVFYTFILIFICFFSVYFF